MRDEEFLKLAIKEAGKAKSEHKFGAVVVLDGKVIAKDHNRAWEKNDPSAHAEVCAIRNSTKKLGTHNIEGATLYGSHEPCIMCFSCAVWSGFARIVFANRADENTHDSYEFTGLSLEDIAKKLNRKVKIEYIDLI